MISTGGKLNLTVPLLALRAGYSLMAWGRPGIGKTKSIYAVAEALGARLIILKLATMEPTDLIGFPQNTDKGMRYNPPDWYVEIATGGRGPVFIFLDELNQASPTNTAAGQSLLDERRIGQHIQLPEGVFIAAAGNRPEDSPSAFELPSQVANRLFHFDWPMDEEAWRVGMLSGWPKPTLPQIPNDWKAKWLPRVIPLVVAFHAASPGKLHIMPRDRAQASYAWPSPRSWEMATHMYAAARAIGADEETQRLCLGGSVGAAVANEFMAFVANQDLPDPEAILADPTAHPLPTDAHRLHVVLGAVVAAVIRKPNQPRWVAAVRVLCRAVEAAGVQDIPALYFMMLNRQVPTPTDPQEIPDEIMNFVDILGVAGLLGKSSRSN